MHQCCCEPVCPGQRPATVEAALSLHLPDQRDWPIRISERCCVKCNSSRLCSGTSAPSHLPQRHSAMTPGCARRPPSRTGAAKSSQDRAARCTGPQRDGGGLCSAADVAGRRRVRRRQRDPLRPRLGADRVLAGPQLHTHHAGRRVALGKLPQRSYILVGPVAPAVAPRHRLGVLRSPMVAHSPVPRP